MGSAVAASPPAVGRAAFVASWIVQTPVVRLGRWSCIPGTTSEWTSERRPEWPLFSFCHEGAFLAEGVGPRALIDGNTLLTVAEGQPYATRRLHLGSGTDIAIEPSLVRDLLEHIQPSGCSRADPTRALARTLDVRLRLLEATVFSWLADPAARTNLALEEVALKLAAAALCQWNPVTSGRVRNRGERVRRQVNAARTFLTLHFRDRFSLADVARAADISPFYLCRSFRLETGLSLHQYVVRLRLHAALGQLAESAPNLSDLAASMGFAHHSHFSDAFRRYYGLTPSEARRLLRGHGTLVARSARASSFDVLPES
jgi:AraC family transcriptional regulator